MNLQVLKSILPLSFMFVVIPLLNAEQPTLKIGVCNLSTLYNDLALSKDRRAELEVLRSQAESELKEYRIRMEVIDREIPLLEKDSPQFKEKIDQIKKLRIEGEAKKKVESAHLERKFADFLKEFYEYTNEGIETLANKKDFDLIIQVTDNELAKYRKPEILLNRIFTQTVLFSKNGIEVTNRVLKSLNREYKKNKRKELEN